MFKKLLNFALFGKRERPFSEPVILGSEHGVILDRASHIISFPINDAAGIVPMDLSYTHKRNLNEIFF